MDQDTKCVGSKKRRRSLRISQELEICGNYGSVWKEPSPESRRVAELKEKRRRRSKIFNTEELLHFRNSETPEHASGDNRLGFLAVHSTPLLEVEEARCPDSNSGQQESLRITPVCITNDANPHSEKVENMKGKVWGNSSPILENRQEVYSTLVAPPCLSDSLPYSPSQSIVADISQSPLVNSLVSPNSPALDMEFFTPFSQIKPRACQKKTGGKLQPKQLSSKFPDQDITKTPGEKLTLLKKSNLMEGSLQTYVTNNDVNNMNTIMKENETIVPCSSVPLTDDATHLEENFTEDQDIFGKEDINVVSTKVKKKSLPRKNSSEVYSSIEPYSSLQLTENATNMEDNKTESQDILEEEDLINVSTKVKKKRGRPRKSSSEVYSSKETRSSVLLTDDATNLEDNFTESQDVLEEEDLNIVSNIKGKKKRGRPRKDSSQVYSSLEPCSSMMLADDTANLENNFTKCEVILEEENQTVEERKSIGTDDTSNLEDNFTENQDILKEEDHDIESIKVNRKGSLQRKNSSDVFPSVEPCSSVLLTDDTINFTDSQEILEEEDHDTASTKVKKKIGRPKKNSPEVLSYVEPCSLVLSTNDTTNFEDNSTECEDILEEENQIVEERKSRRLRRRSFEIYRCSEEESSGQSDDSELQQEGKDFGTVLKDVNGKSVPAKAPRKKKKPESEDDINKIYTAKNYIPPPVKALETISESPTLAKQARKLKRLIEFGSLYHIPPIKQKKRQCKAAKRGWDPRKFRKNKIPDEVAQLKLQSVWEDLDKDSPTF